MLKPYDDLLAGLSERGRLRQLAPAAGHDFTSNDFLGLAESAELKDAIRQALDRGVPAGAGGSRLLRGNHPEHIALEEEAAAFFGAKSALYFATGFAANYALFAGLPQRGDLVVHDALIHASAHDGMRAGRAELAEARAQRCGRFRGQDPRLAGSGRQRAAVDRGGKPVQHGWRPRAAWRSRHDCRAP